MAWVLRGVAGARRVEAWNLAVGQGARVTLTLDLAPPPGPWTLEGRLPDGTALCLSICSLRPEGGRWTGAVEAPPPVEASYASTPEEWLYCTGVDMDTGERAIPPLSPRDLAAVARGRPEQAEHPERLEACLNGWLDGVEDLLLPPPPGEREARELTARAAAAKGQLGVVHGVDVRRLASAGWGVVFAEDDPLQALRRAQLAPLLAHRQAGAGPRYRELVYRAGWDKPDFLASYGASPGRVDPACLPYYLLLVGDPDQIPFDFQYQLGVQHAVGRLHFDDLAAFGRYAASVVEAETAGSDRQPDALFFGTTSDPGVSGVTRGLLEPLAQGAGRPVCGLTGPQATRDRLLDTLDQRRPALLFTTTHGAEHRAVETEAQRRTQGALVCHGWRGPGAPPAPETLLTGDSLGDDAHVHGLIAIHFACFGAGTPRVDTFTRSLLQGRGLAPRPLRARRDQVSWLPQALLGHPNGGALAVISHVDRAWSSSFRHMTGQGAGAPAERKHFEALLRGLEQGLPVGAAFDDFGTWYAERDSSLRSLMELFLEGEAVEDRDLAMRWMAAKDARSWVILGDPAVRLQ
ncbi:MAG: hypothetical protein H6739_09725 [Alphaproteobacteria bacterium]|nr:hypothetical protein [Alphaproteobacteria bacterium]